LRAVPGFLDRTPRVTSHVATLADNSSEAQLHATLKLVSVSRLLMEFERLGDSRTSKSNARLIAATNRDLEDLFNEQKFRLDLYYRLNVFPFVFRRYASAPRIFRLRFDR
jgi:transcriptional regulator of acetoin/glycerol metabolism